MIISRGDPSVFLTRPISAGFMIASILMLVLLALPALRKKREEVFVEEDELGPRKDGKAPARA